MLGLLDIDPSAAAPIWRQIEDGMRRLVASGALPVGTRGAVGARTRP